MTDLVNLDRVRSLLRSLTCRRRFLKHLDEKQRGKSKYEQGKRSGPTFTSSSKASNFSEIPSILVDGLPQTPPMSSRDITSPTYNSPGSPSPRKRNFGGSQDMTFSLELAPNARLQRSTNMHGRRNSEQSTNTLSMFSESMRSPYVMRIIHP